MYISFSIVDACSIISLDYCNMYTALQVSFLLLCVSFKLVCSSDENINIYHIFSSDYVTSEPDNVLKNTVQWINDNTSFITGKKLILNSMDMVVLINTFCLLLISLFTIINHIIIQCYQDSDEELSSVILSQSFVVIIDGTCPSGSKLVEEISQSSDNTLYVICVLINIVYN